MSMHNSEASFERINKSVPETRDREPEEDNKSKKRCIVIILLVCLLAAAVTALILVLVFKGGSGVPNGINGFTIQNQEDGKWYWEALIRRTEPVQFPVPVDETNPEFSDLRMRVSMMNDHTFRLRINPVKSNSNSIIDAEDIPRWEVPDYLMANTKDDYGMRMIWGGFEFAETNVGIQLSNPNKSGQRFFSTMGRNLIFTDQYIEQGFLIDSRHIFGFGERHRTFELETGNYTAWANGRDNEVDPADLGHNSYGDHPFVLARLHDNTFIGIFFLNSNAKVLEYTHTGKDQSILNFRAIGGILDFITFSSETAEGVIKAYQGVVGTPYFPPFWTLGFHQSSWQYNNTERVESVVKGYSDAGMPLECMWLDIEYMLEYRNFVVDTSRFSDFKGLTTKLHKDNQKLVTIVDAGFAADVPGYTFYEEASEAGLFIRSAQHPGNFSGNLIGDVWPGKSAFIDFYHPNSTAWWVKSLISQHSQTLMDGIWIDMNEATSFCTGECPFDKNDTSVSNSDRPFNPTGDKDPIEVFSISLDGKHYNATPEEAEFNVEFNMHSLYGTMQAHATHRFWYDANPLKSRRPFVLSRSTFAGAGKWTSHWTGDNLSSWEFMRLSISGIMNFNMYGIPLTGSDVCGFHGKYEDEMCGRWMQLSVFYPFARNHYNLTDRDQGYLPEQEPFKLIEPYKDMARLAIVQRYRFIRYYYTRLYEVSHEGGGTLVRPLFFEFPADDDAYKGYEHTFMVGNALKVTPVLSPASEHNGKLDSYFPANSRFISLNDMKTVIEQGTTGKNLTLDVSDTFTIVHMKDGTMIPYQESSDQVYPNRTTELLSSEISLYGFPDKSGRAEGSLYIDLNGDDRDGVQNGLFQYYGFTLNNGTIRFNNLGGKGAAGDTTTGNQVLGEIVLLGMNAWKGKEVAACAFDQDLVHFEIAADYDEEIDAIRISVTKFYESNDNITTKIELDISAGNSTALPDLKATFTLVDDTILRVEIRDPTDEKAFKAPKETFQEGFPPQGAATIDITSVLSIPADGEEFYYEVHQKNNPSKVYYSTKGRSFVYSKYYKKTTAGIDSTGKIFGLSERVGDFFLSEGVYTIWNRDEPSPIENGVRPGNNIYGTHPVYFAQMTSNTEFFGVFDHNVGAQDYIIRKVNKSYQITQVKTTGVTDKFILLSDSVQNVVKNFHKIVGNPVLVPEWSLGWHQCRYGYNDTAQVAKVVEEYLAHDLPLDVIWTDIDYMEQYRDFTLSRSDFADLPAKIKEWREKNIRYIPILDAGIAYEPNAKDSSYARLKSKKLYITDGNNNNEPFIGKVWPGSAVYIDWLKNGAEEFWVNEMEGLYKELPFDGMWIDMNEAANFCNGACTSDQEVKNSVRDQLFYTPGARDLNTKAISVDAKHADGSIELEAHSTYGFYMSKATSKYFTKQDKRPFVITRSTYSGVGKYVSHWLGDNFSDYKYLKYSVGGVYLFNMYGVPVAGADICGFIGDTNKDLCARWYALGAFYPFSRNHNDKAAIAQEPFVPMFSDSFIEGIFNYTYTDFIREASWRRYALHRYQYSYLHKSSEDGTPYFTPLFYKYSDDPLAYKDVESNILLGDSVKISPILNDDENGKFYFPEKGAPWCPIWPKYQKTCFDGQSIEKSFILPLDEIFAHIKSGSVIPLQLGDLKSVPKNVNLETLKNIPIDLGVMVDKNYKASGWFRYDDGETRDITAYSQFSFSVTGANPVLGTAYCDIIVSIDKDSSTTKEDKNQNLGSIVMYNAKKLSLGTGAKAKITLNNGDPVELSATYEKTNNICRFIVKEDSGIELRNVKSIHVSSK